VAERQHTAAVSAFQVQSCERIDAALARGADARDAIDIVAAEDPSLVMQQCLQFGQQK
jgi:hypothetical protein